MVEEVYTISGSVTKINFPCKNKIRDEISQSVKQLKITQMYLRLGSELKKLELSKNEAAPNWAKITEEDGKYYCYGCDVNEQGCGEFIPNCTYIQGLLDSKFGPLVDKITKIELVVQKY